MHCVFSITSGMHIDMLSIFLLLSRFCYLQLHVAAFTIIASRFVLKSPLWRATNPRSIVRMQQSIGIPSIPGSIMTDFGRTLRDDINKILVPIQDESTLQEELRDTVYREVCMTENDSFCSHTEFTVMIKDVPVHPQPITPYSLRLSLIVYVRLNPS